MHDFVCDGLFGVLLSITRLYPYKISHVNVVTKLYVDFCNSYITGEIDLWLVALYIKRGK